MAEHVHDISVRTTIRADGVRIYESVGPCLSCGQPIEPIPSVTETELEANRGVTWAVPDGGSLTQYARGKIDG